MQRLGSQEEPGLGEGLRVGCWSTQELQWVLGRVDRTDRGTSLTAQNTEQQGHAQSYDMVPEVSNTALYLLLWEPPHKGPLAAQGEREKEKSRALYKMFKTSLNVCNLLTLDTKGKTISSITFMMQRLCLCFSIRLKPRNVLYWELN